MDSNRQVIYWPEPLERADLSEVRDGDLIFTARETAYQWLCEVAGDPWRHVGIAVLIDGEPHLADVYGDRFTHRALADVLVSQQAVGLGRLTPDLEPCARKAARWARTMLDQELVYAWDDLVLAGILLATRTRLRLGNLDRVKAAVAAAEDHASNRPDSPLPTFTCSGFVHEAFHQAGARCRLEVPIVRLHSTPVRFRDNQPQPVPPHLLDGITSDERDELLTRHSLYALSAWPEPTGDGRLRASHGSHMSVPQFTRSVRNLVHVVAGFARGGPVPPHLPLDGRWVTPGDLWSLPALGVRRFLKTPPPGM